MHNYDDSLLLPELIYQEFYFFVQKSIYIIGIQSVKVIRDWLYLSFLYFNFILGEGNPCIVPNYEKKRQACQVPVIRF